MTSAHHHHNKYSLPPPPQSSQNDFLRLPSLKDLNFQYASPTNGARTQPQAPEPAPQQQEHSAIPRHVAWGRSTQNSSSNPSANSHPHQQHTPPLSAGAHEMSAAKVEYPSKHENGGYVHPGVPLSAQVTPVPGSVNIGNLRNEEPPHSPNQPKRSRPISTMGASRDVRTSHVSLSHIFVFPRLIVMIANVVSNTPVCILSPRITGAAAASSKSVSSNSVWYARTAEPSHTTRCSSSSGSRAIAPTTTTSYRCNKSS